MHVANLSFLTVAYQPEYWYLECIIFVYKFTLAGVLVFVGKSIGQLALALVFAIFWVAYFARVRPFRFSELNFQQDCFGVSLCLVLLSAVLTELQNEEIITGISTVTIDIAACVVTLLPFLITLRILGRLIRKKRQTVPKLDSQDLDGVMPSAGDSNDVQQLH